MSRKRGSRIFRARQHDWKDAGGGVRYVQFASEPGNPAKPLVVLSELPPNHVEPPHTHDCDYIEIVIEGALAVGKSAPMGSGDMRATSAGTGYGPLVAGPGGCLRLTIFETAAGSMMRLLGKAAA